MRIGQDAQLVLQYIKAYNIQTVAKLERELERETKRNGVTDKRHTRILEQSKKWEGVFRK